MKLIQKSLLSLLTWVILIAFALPVFAGKGEHPSVKSSKALNRLKTLEGSWEGVDPENSNEKVRVKYHVTSGGTALVEKLFPGTPHEMVSVYYDRNGIPHMTHYCLLGNQPELELKKVKGNTYEFDLSPRNTINVQKESHMHALTIILNDSNHITQKWVSYDNGKASEPHVLKYTRIKDK